MGRENVIFAKNTDQMGVACVFGLYFYNLYVKDSVKIGSFGRKMGLKNANNPVLG